MWAVLSLMGVSFIGSVFWVVSTEAAAVYYGGSRGWWTPVVGRVGGVSRAAMYVILYSGGDPLVQRWGWLRRTVARTRIRFADHLERRFLTLTGIAAIFGMPPVVPIVALASSFGVTWRHALPVALAGRIVRFTLLAWAGESLLEWWRLV